MSFDPSLATTLDRIRLLVGDTDTTAEVYPDATYDAAIMGYANWKWAAAEMADAVAVKYDLRATGIVAQGDASINWGDRAKTLRATAVRLRAEAAAEDASGDGAGKLVTFTADFLTGGDW